MILDIATASLELSNTVKKKLSKLKSLKQPASANKLRKRSAQQCCKKSKVEQT